MATAMVRRVLTGAALVLVFGAGAVAGAAGSPLILGQANSAGTAQTTLTANVAGAAFTLKDTNTFGTGIFGWTSATTGPGRGVYGRSDSSAGMGVLGRATRNGGEGVRGELTSALGSAIHGVVTQTGNIGTTYAVRGENLAANGIGVYGSALTHGSNIGGLFEVGTGGSAVGVIGRGFRGVLGEGFLGVTGISRPQNGGTGVVGTGYTLGGDFHATSGGFSTAGIRAVAAGPGSGVTARSDSGAGIFAFSTSGVAVDAGSTSGDIMRGYGPNRSLGDIEFRITNTGDVFADGTFTPGGADFAESLPAVAGLVPGEVLVVGRDGRLTRSSTANDAAVVGVYSTKPGVLGGYRGSSAGRAPLAILGVVPVKVTVENGAIRPGDLLTSSGRAGHAMRAPADPRPGTILGKALGSLPSGEGTIQVLLLLQ